MGLLKWPARPALEKIMIRTALTVASIILAAAHSSAEEKTLRVYFVGNSVTDTINYRALADLAKSRGYQPRLG